MTVEEIRIDSENSNKFHVGLRVLAVDDDPVCLKILQTLLRKCQYNVTTTTQARMALKMLREHKDEFDLVISDVHMPDMDGFKLLELVGLEMDLPVIMLSENSDPSLVMKGVTHGACDYLVKPVRIEELRNIWQHLLRRKKIDLMNQSMRGGKVESGGEDNVSSSVSNDDRNVKSNRKRKDEEGEKYDNGNENQEPASQKKPRVVWSIELHQKFVTAVTQLGIEQAVPKRILDMMNVEGLTRENVASHLQKYRLYLKRYSKITAQQANMVAFGIKDSQFMQMGSLDLLDDFQALGGDGRLPLSSYAQGRMLDELHSPSHMGLHNIYESSLVTANHAKKLSNSFTVIGEIHESLSPGRQNPSLFQGTPSLKLDKLHHEDDFHINVGDDSRIFTVANTHMNQEASVCCSSNLLNDTADNSMMPVGGFVDQSSDMISFNSESFSVGVSGLQDSCRRNGEWKFPIDLPKLQSSYLLSNNAFCTQFPLGSGRDNRSSNAPYLMVQPHDVSSTKVASMPVQDLRESSTEGLVTGLQNMPPASIQRWDQPNKKYATNQNNALGILNSQISTNDAMSPTNQILNHNRGIFDQKMDMLANGKGPQIYDPMDDLVNTMMIQEQATTPTCAFGFDDFPFGFEN